MQAFTFTKIHFTGKKRSNPFIMIHCSKPNNTNRIAFIELSMFSNTHFPNFDSIYLPSNFVIK